METPYKFVLEEGLGRDGEQRRGLLIHFQSNLSCSVRNNVQRCILQLIMFEVVTFLSLSFIDGESMMT